MKIVDPNTYGIPTQVMKWTTMSLRKIVSILKEKFNINVCHSVVQDILQEEGYSRQKNKKAEQVGKADPDRDEQFRFIDWLSAEFLASGIL